MKAHAIHQQRLRCWVVEGPGGKLPGPLEVVTQSPHTRLPIEQGVAALERLIDRLLSGADAYIQFRESEPDKAKPRQAAIQAIVDVAAASRDDSTATLGRRLLHWIGKDVPGDEALYLLANAEMLKVRI